MANTTGKKYGGRKKGTPNKVTSEIKEYYSEFLSNNKEKLQVCFDKLVEHHPERAMALFIKIGSYVLPKLKAVEFEESSEEKDNVIIIRTYDPKKD